MPCDLVKVYVKDDGGTRVLAFLLSIGLLCLDGDSSSDMDEHGHAVGGGPREPSPR